MRNETDTRTLTNVCKCCGKVFPRSGSPICFQCWPVAIELAYDPQNDNLTIAELRKRIQIEARKRNP